VELSSRQELEANMSFVGISNSNTSPTKFVGVVGTSDPTQDGQITVNSFGQTSSSYGVAQILQPVYLTARNGGTFSGTANIPTGALITGIKVYNTGASAVPGSTTVNIGLSASGTQIMNTTLTLAAYAYLDLFADFATGYGEYLPVTYGNNLYYVTASSQLTSAVAATLTVVFSYMQSPTQS
jgi:hypothetical protein